MIRVTKTERYIDRCWRTKREVLRQSDRWAYLDRVLRNKGKKNTKCTSEAKEEEIE